MAISYSDERFAKSETNSTRGKETEEPVQIRGPAAGRYSQPKIFLYCTQAAENFCAGSNSRRLLPYMGRPTLQIILHTFLRGDGRDHLPPTF